ncbi:MAG: ATP-dependent protease subunit HslV [Deltaproteobacteria bacterium]|jgi:ATP-dependent HslUV protease subunit HslV|nr:ATP-dependent protease subunit HslV [Deltaproteobacteria bacterium]
MKHRGTTILLVRHNGQAAICGDGQVTYGPTVAKSTAKKIRRVGDGRIICGFAGGAADAMAILERFEQHLAQHAGNLTRATVELAKDWRLDRGLRRLEATLVVADAKSSFYIAGTGDVMEPDENVLHTGSGGPFAAAAAKALIRHAPHLTASQIAEESLLVAADICIYTNKNLTLETLDCD